MGTMRHPALRTRYRGKLVLWNDARYFGFIQCSTALPTGSTDIFVHRLNFMAGIPTAAIHVDADVEFEIGAPYKVGHKEQAVRVKLIEPVQPNVGLGALVKGGQGGGQ